MLKKTVASVYIYIKQNWVENYLTVPCVCGKSYAKSFCNNYALICIGVVK